MWLLSFTSSGDIIWKDSLTLDTPPFFLQKSNTSKTYTMEFSCKFIILVFFASIYACSTENSTDNREVNEDNVELKPIGEALFPLDTLIGFENNSICAFKHNGKEYISILNSKRPSVYIYEYESKKLIKKILLNTEGPDGVGILNDNVSQFMDNMDSVYILNSWTKKLFILNDKGNVLKSIMWEADNSPLIANAYSCSSNPMFKNENIMYIPLYPFAIDAVNFDYEKIPTAMSIDLDKGKVVDYLFYLPDTYNLSFWGATPFKFRSNFLFDPQGENVIVSYAVDPKIYVFNKNKVQRTHDMHSKHFSMIKPMMTKIPKVDEIGADFNERDREYALTNPDFNFLIHDPINKLYLRLVYLRPTIEQYKSGSTIPHSSIIILDEGFNKIGETFFNGGIYRPDVFFFNQKGLHIARQDKYSRDENHLSFDIFEVVNKSK